MNAAHRVMAVVGDMMKSSPSASADERSTLAKRTSHSLTRLCDSLVGPLCRSRDHFLHLFGLGPWVHSSISIAQQLDLRCEQFTFILRQAWLLQVTDTGNNELSTNYISTQNCIWLILNDIIIGTAVGTTLVENKAYLARLVLKLAMHLTVDSMRESISWLDNWPAGLKLNTELSRFFFLIFNALLEFWSVVLIYISYALPTIIELIGISGVLGMTMILACTSDLVSLLTAHLFMAYTVVRVAFRTQLLTTNSLYNLFRGKRYNVLRRRLDSWYYDLDQLLLGAMLFTLSSFLFPTVLVYYVLFALTRLALQSLQAGLKVALALLNHFPLFALTLRIKDPWRLPGGVTLRPREDRQGFIIKNSPIALSKIFDQYFVLGSRLASHYNPMRLIIAFVKGNRLDSIPHKLIRYTYRTQGPQLHMHN
ncbi:Gpi1-domain-containing protein [Fomitiporia mediterranea MF3/22]|uniref:Gpi1-domain-containing protein n=1 Tax=Fomitiporia mediterranea (strain MF3/22) TaxID=694068 RepID=UPI0004408E8B|nr:Gpi1-domain-containing protein [Fomitiporia mediterranea MF3/22]EJD03990.1 Gpi1-domain-containing protein [Fomitiporia mediterranea MF3/22]